MIRTCSALLAFLLATFCAFQQPATAGVIFIEDSNVQVGLSTPVCEWRDPQVQPWAVLLCLHGFCSHGEVYDSLARDLLSQGVIVYAPDIRGFGRTYFPQQQERVSYTTYADADVCKLAVVLRAKYPTLKLFVCGESMGGALALHLAAKRPDLVDGLILSAPSVKLMKHVRFVMRSLVLMSVHGGVINISAQILHFASSAANARQFLADPMMRTNYRASELLECVRVTKETRKMLSTVPPDVPILLLQGSEDLTVNPRIVKIMRKELRTRDLTVIEAQGKGHVLLELNEPDAEALSSIKLWLTMHKPV